MASSPITETPQSVRETLGPLRSDFSIALLAAGNAFAIGAVIRVAHSFLAREIILVGEGGWYAKASMGMHKYESIIRVPDAEALRRATAGRPLWVVEKDYARRSVTSRQPFPPDVVFLLGSERFGVPREIAESADEVVGIPIYGINHSLPVAVAAGIVMHEWARRRFADGTVR
jgi:tRNA G18 (ribose-2'-O)-methylase SpoU